MSNKVISLVGFGSQGTAWAQCLKQSGWAVQIFLSRREGSYQRALELGFKPQLLEELPKSLMSQESSLAWIAMLCPDMWIGPIYREYLANLPRELRLILAHGFAIYSHDLVLSNPKHQATLLAPKAIGPKLLQSFKAFYPQPHPLSAAISAPKNDRDRDRVHLVEIARSLGFAESALIPASFEQEATGDLMSEQGLLCGGIFNLLRWTAEAMKKAGVPEALIREECITELELIAGLIRERGAGPAFKAISQAAQCGTVAMEDCFEASGFKEQFQAQMRRVQDQSFASFFRTQRWQDRAKKIAEDLSQLG